jgi:hypothetical protein
VKKRFEECEKGCAIFRCHVRCKFYLLISQKGKDRNNLRLQPKAINPQSAV